MKYLTRFLLLFSGVIFFSSNCASANRKNERSTLAPSIIKDHGYLCESHKVQTADGYILTVHRIPHGKSKSSRPTKGVVFLQHGVLGTSADWTLLGPDDSLPYVLANDGYDVWMGNARGNSYFKNHTTLRLDSTEFWNFSWHEMGIYDLPGVIDYILKKTNREKLFYIGHSMGTTMFFVMASLKPEYAEKVDTMFALAPVANLSHMETNLFKEVISLGFKMIWSDVLQNDEFFLTCNLPSWFHFICKDGLFRIVGPNQGQFNESLTTELFKQMPDGTSTKTLKHFKQVQVSKKFQQYNYYNASHPPIYDLSAIKTSIILYHSDSDWYSNEKDVDSLCKELGSKCVKMNLVNFTGFNHMDFLWGKGARSLIYNDILEDLNDLTKPKRIFFRQASTFRTDWKTLFRAFRFLITLIFT